MCQLWGQDFVNFALNPDNDGVIIEKLRRRSLLADIALCHNRSLQTIKPVSHVNDSCKVICLTIVFKRFNGLIPLSGDSSIHEILNNISYNQEKSSIFNQIKKKRMAMIKNIQIQSVWIIAMSLSYFQLQNGACISLIR